MTSHFRDNFTTLPSSEQFRVKSIWRPLGVTFALEEVHVS